MRNRLRYLIFALLAGGLLASTNAFAQGGGASTTGSINGKVADTSTLVLPIHFPTPTAGRIEADGDRFHYIFRR